MRRKVQTDELSDHDAAVWQAVEVLQKTDRGLTEQLPRQATTFPPQLGAGEQVVAVAPFQLFAHTTAGDGVYMHNSAPFVAVGRGAALGASLAVSGMVAAGTAAGNARRRAAAAHDASQQWRPIDRGNVYISTHGFYMHTAQGLLTWAFGSVRGAEMISPGHVSVVGQSSDGPVHWVLSSLLAEMLFSQWARQIHPGHPQMANHSWIPEGWAHRVSASKYDLPSFGLRQVDGR